MKEAKYREAERRLWKWAGKEPKEHFVDLPRIGTRVRVQEVGDGQPALFIHGGPNSGSTWAPLLEHLEGFRCMVLDRPGTGLSERYDWAPGTVAGFGSRLVADTLDALEIDQAHVVASSFGGYCALQSAAVAPDRFMRMVQMAAPAMLPGQTLPPFMKTVMVPGMRKLIAALPPNKRAQASIMRQIGHGKSIDRELLPELHTDWYSALQRYTDTMRNDFDLIYSIKADEGFDPEMALDQETLALVPVPTHFIWGDDDTFGGEQDARWVVAAMPNASLEMLPDAGHLPWLDDAEHVAAATREFLEAG
jgi:4,5:9,10-diseco-3-hydroxy-5,9,17-trioxoandrosta-1(10),2-diene-4-oate hydrolase